MTDKINKHNIFVYSSDGNPVDITENVIDWQITNGGVDGDASGIDGVVRTANMTIANSINNNLRELDTKKL